MKRRPPKSGTKISEINTLVVDGNALFKTGFHGATNEFNRNGQHIGGIYQFITVIRKLLNENIYQKVFVFWDGLFSGKLRYEIYPDYKSSRGKDYINGTKPDDPNQIIERAKVQQYLEDLFIRQIRNEDIVEGDDFIAYYCKHKKSNEKITIATNDMDICQLVSKDIQVYLLGKNKKFYVTDYNYSQIFNHHQKNLVLIKTICGDISDSIKGVKGLGEKSLLKYFPFIVERPVSLQEVLIEAQKLQDIRKEEKKKPLQSLTNLLEGITTDKTGKETIIMGNKLYLRNKSLVDLSEPLMTKKSISKIKDLMKGNIDPEGRGIKEVYTKMKRDGIDEKIGNSGIEYLIPFKKLIEREKQNIIT